MTSSYLVLLREATHDFFLPIRAKQLFVHGAPYAITVVAAKHVVSSRSTCFVELPKRHPHKVVHSWLEPVKI